MAEYLDASLYFYTSRQEVWKVDREFSSIFRLAGNKIMKNLNGIQAISDVAM